MHWTTIARYGIWAGVAATANANRRHYHMATTWVPHLASNTITLLLPEIQRLAMPHLDAVANARLHGEAQDTWRLVRRVGQRMIDDNPDYVLYVTPLALGYLLSHPEFNIYKGGWSELKLAGFGLDAIPHATTAFALTELVYDTLCTGVELLGPHTDATRLLHWMHEHHGVTSALVLALVTAWWEFGEYSIYRQEMAERGNMDEINMQWSVDDMVFDCLANMLGWMAARGWQYTRQSSALAG